VPNQPVRENRSFFAAGEQKLIRLLVSQLPSYVTPLLLTGIGVAGSFLASLALIACNWSNVWLAALTFGIALNWFGDSLDGSLARYRGVERPRFGFLVDHTCDLFSQLLIIVSFGFSPYLSVFSALIILICYLFFSAYTYIRAATQRIHQMAYIGIGATEFRILMIVYPLIAATLDVHEEHFGGLTKIDIAIALLAIIAILSLALKALVDARELANLEPPTKTISSVDEQDKWRPIEKRQL
jgi:phosphatidylglycerophosphate synthase